MKKSYLFGIGIIAIAIIIIISSAGDASTYVDFGAAQEMAGEGNSEKIHVVGKLLKDESGKVMGMEEGVDKLSFTFMLQDDKNKVEKVYHFNPIPADFQRSEQVVVIGSYRNNKFVADKILMKCPSKYQENKLVVSNSEYSK